jgi:hypothetical protein
VAIVTAPQDGTATIDGTEIVYTPASDFVGSDSVVYSLTDDLGAVTTATLTLNVVSDEPPVVNASTYSAYAGEATTLDVLSNDSDPAGHPLTIVSATTDLSGTVTIVPGTNGAPDQLTYTAPTWFLGTEVVTYVVSDPLGSTATTTATINVTQRATPEIATFQLDDDTGDPNDLVTSDPTVTGSVQSTRALDQVLVQFSFDNGNTVGDTTTVDDNGNFLFDPTADISLGDVTIYARAADTDGNGNVILTGSWSVLSFQWVPDRTSVGDPGAASFTSLGVTTNTPSSVVISGVTTLDANGQTPSVQFDLTGNGVPTVTTTVGSDLSFSQSFTTNIGYFNQMIYARTVSGTGSGQLVGAWEAISFYRDAPPIAPPDLSNLALVDNTGTSGSPASTNALISGIASSPDFPVSSVAIQVDLTGDGTPTETFQPTIGSDGSFTVDLNSLLTTDGPITVAFRAAEANTITNVELDGDWHTLTFQYSGNAAAVPEVTNLAVVNNVGTAGSPTTSDLLISGTVQGVLANYSWINVAVELNGHTSPDATVAVADLVNGTFVFDLSGLGLTAGPVTAQFIATADDSVKQETLTGDSSELDFTYAPMAPPAPVIDSLQLVNNTDAGDGTTSDPRVSAIATLNGQTLSGSPIDFELNGDTQPDGTFYAASDGSFVFDPRDNNIQPGPVTVSFRAAVWSDADDGYDYGAWQSISYTYEPATTNPTAPTVSNLAVVSPANPDGSYSSPIVAGSATAAGSTSPLVVQFDVGNDGVVDGTTRTSADGSSGFIVDLTPYLTADGSYTVAFRAVETDSTTGQETDSNWVTITFTYEALQLGSGDPPPLPSTSNIPVPPAELAAGTAFSSGVFDFVDNPVTPQTEPSGAVTAPATPGAQIINGLLTNAAANVPSNGVPVTVNLASTSSSNGDTSTTSGQTTSSNTVNVYQVGDQELVIQQISISSVTSVVVKYPDGSEYIANETDAYNELIEAYVWGGGDSYTYTNVSSSEQLATYFFSPDADMYSVTTNRTYAATDDHAHKINNTPPESLGVFDGKVATNLLTLLGSRSLLQNWAAGDFGWLPTLGDLDDLSEVAALSQIDSLGNILTQSYQEASLKFTPLNGASPTLVSVGWSSMDKKHTVIDQVDVTDDDQSVDTPNGSYESDINITESLIGTDDYALFQWGTLNTNANGTTVTWKGQLQDSLIEQYSLSGTETISSESSQSFGGLGSFDVSMTTTDDGMGGLTTTKFSQGLATGSWSGVNNGPLVLTSWGGGLSQDEFEDYVYSDSNSQTGSETSTSNFGGKTTDNSYQFALELDYTGNGSSTFVSSEIDILANGIMQSTIVTNGTLQGFDQVLMPEATAALHSETSYAGPGADGKAILDANSTSTLLTQVTTNGIFSGTKKNGVETSIGTLKRDISTSGTDNFFVQTSSIDETNFQGPNPPGEVASTQSTTDSYYTDDGAFSGDEVAIVTSANGEVTGVSLTFNAATSDNFSIYENDRDQSSDQNRPIPLGTQSTTADDNYLFVERGTDQSTTTGTSDGETTNATTRVTENAESSWTTTGDATTDTDIDFLIVNLQGQVIGAYSSTSKDVATYDDQGSGTDTYNLLSQIVIDPGGTSETDSSNSAFTQKGETTATDTTSFDNLQTSAFGNGLGISTLTQTGTGTTSSVTDYATFSNDQTTASTAGGSFSQDWGSDSTTVDSTLTSSSVSELVKNFNGNGLMEDVSQVGELTDDRTSVLTNDDSWASNTVQGQTLWDLTSTYDSTDDTSVGAANSTADKYTNFVSAGGSLFQGATINGTALNSSLSGTDVTTDIQNDVSQFHQLQQNGLWSIDDENSSTQSQAGETSSVTNKEIDQQRTDGTVKFNTDGLASVDTLFGSTQINDSASDGSSMLETVTYTTTDGAEANSTVIWTGVDGANFEQDSDSERSTSYNDTQTSNYVETFANGQTQSSVQTYVDTGGDIIQQVDTKQNVANFSNGVQNIPGRTFASEIANDVTTVKKTNLTSDSKTTTDLFYARGNPVGQKTVIQSALDSGTIETTSSKDDTTVSSKADDSINLFGVYSRTDVSIDDHLVSSADSSKFYGDSSISSVTQLVNPNGALVVIKNAGSGSSTDQESDTFDLTDKKTNQTTTTTAWGDSYKDVAVSSTTTTDTKNGSDNFKTTTASVTTLAGTTSLKKVFNVGGTFSAETKVLGSTKDITIAVPASLFQGATTVFTHSSTTATLDQYGSQGSIANYTINTANGKSTYAGTATATLQTSSTQTAKELSTTDTQTLPVVGTGWSDKISTTEITNQAAGWSNSTLTSVYQPDGSQISSGAGTTGSSSKSVADQITTMTSTDESFIPGIFLPANNGATAGTWKIDTTSGTFSESKDTELTASEASIVIQANGTFQLTPIAPEVGYVAKSIISTTSGSQSTTTKVAVFGGVGTTTDNDVDTKQSGISGRIYTKTTLPNNAGIQEVYTLLQDGNNESLHNNETWTFKGVNGVQTTLSDYVAHSSHSISNSDTYFTPPGGLQTFITSSWEIEGKQDSTTTTGSTQTFASTEDAAHGGAIGLNWNGGGLLLAGTLTESWNTSTKKVQKFQVSYDITGELNPDGTYTVNVNGNERDGLTYNYAFNQTTDFSSAAQNSASTHFAQQISDAANAESETIWQNTYISPAPSGINPIVFVDFGTPQTATTYDETFNEVTTFSGTATLGGGRGGLLLGDFPPGQPTTYTFSGKWSYTDQITYEFGFGQARPAAATVVVSGGLVYFVQNINGAALVFGFQPGDVFNNYDLSTVNTWIRGEVGPNALLLEIVPTPQPINTSIFNITQFIQQLNVAWNVGALPAPFYPKLNQLENFIQPYVQIAQDYGGRSLDGATGAIVGELKPLWALAYSSPIPDISPPFGHQDAYDQGKRIGTVAGVAIDYGLTFSKAGKGFFALSKAVQWGLRAYKLLKAGDEIAKGLHEIKEQGLGPEGLKEVGWGALEAVLALPCFVAETMVVRGGAESATLMVAPEDIDQLEDDSATWAGPSIVLALSAVPLGILLVQRARRRRRGEAAESYSRNFLRQLWDSELLDHLWNPGYSSGATLDGVCPSSRISGARAVETMQ